jgi:hypothetical protein
LEKIRLSGLLRPCLGDEYGGSGADFLYSFIIAEDLIIDELDKEESYEFDN